MTTPNIDIVDEKPGSASTVDALLAPSDPGIHPDVLEAERRAGIVNPRRAVSPPPQPAKRAQTAPHTASSGDLARVQTLIARWKLDDVATLQARADEGGRSLIDQAKSEARSVQASQGGKARQAQLAASKRETSQRSHKATGKGFSGVRNVQTAQQLLSKQERDIAELRAELEAAKLANAASAARAEVLSTSEGLDDLTAGFASLLGFLFDGVSEMRRMHYEQTASRQGRPLDADELRAVNGWQMPDKRAEAIARPFAQYFATRMGPEVVELLPLFIGIGGLGGFILKGVQGERLAKAERTDARIMGAQS